MIWIIYNFFTTHSRFLKSARLSDDIAGPARGSATASLNLLVDAGHAVDIKDMKSPLIRISLIKSR